VTGLVGLAAQALPGDNGGLPRFFFIDGHQADAPRGGPLAALPDVLPEPMRLVGTRDLADVLATLTAELERRQASPDGDWPSVYLVLHGAHRMRDLRRKEDDFGSFGRADEGPPTPDKQLATILREGPALGIHTLAWCDTLTNVQRVFDRQAMRELAMRVVFQMSVADSGNLIDSPSASKLGLHRALFCNEEEGRLEKFRPYGVPPAEWLAWAKGEFRRRVANCRVT
jgi:hypothetical protein